MISSDLKQGQKVSINGMLEKYKVIQNMRITNFGKVEKRVFQCEERDIYQCYSLKDGSKTLKTRKSSC